MGPYVFTRAGQPCLLHCDIACRGGARKGTMQLTCLSPVHHPKDSWWSFFHHGNPHYSPLSALSLSFAFSQPCPCSPLPCHGFSQLALPARSAASLQVLTGLVVLVDFLNFLVVGVPCSLIFWSFWLFIDFRLVVILLLVVQGSKRFLPTPPS